MKDSGTMEHFNFSAWLSALGYIILAAIGGALGSVMRDHDKGNPLNGWRVFSEALSSGFVGFLVMLLCRAMHLDPLWSGFVVGIFGWLGASASIRLLERMVYEKLGIKLRANTDKRVAAAKERTNGGNDDVQ